MRDLVESWSEPCDAVVFLQTIEHVQDPAAVLAHFRDMLRPGGTAYVSTPNLLTLAPPGAEKSDNPWHVREYRAEEFRKLCASVFGQRRAARALPRARAARRTSSRSAPAGTAFTPRSGSRGAFYDRFTPAISARDFALRPGPLERALDFVAVLRP